MQMMRRKEHQRKCTDCDFVTGVTANREPLLRGKIYFSFDYILHKRQQSDNHGFGIKSNSPGK